MLLETQEQRQRNDERHVVASRVASRRFQAVELSDSKRLQGARTLTKCAGCGASWSACAAAMTFTFCCLSRRSIVNGDLLDRLKAITQQSFIGIRIRKDILYSPSNRNHHDLKLPPTRRRSLLITTYSFSDKNCYFLENPIILSLPT